MRRAAAIMEEIGLEKERLGMFFMSGSQARAFAAAAHTMTERIRELGPSPLRKEELLEREANAHDMDSEEEVGFRGRAAVPGD